jgi:hypothetical protein
LAGPDIEDPRRHRLLRANRCHSNGVIDVSEADIEPEGAIGGLWWKAACLVSGSRLGKAATPSRAEIYPKVEIP